MTEKQKPKAPPDWERIELDYRAGVKSNREIGAEHGVTEGAIRKRAKAQEWVKDLAGKIQAKADELVRRDAVRAEVRANQVASEKSVVDANAQAIADVRLAHRKDIGRARALTNALLDELAMQTDPETLQRLRTLGELMFKPDEKTGRDKLNEIYHDIISLPERAKTMKTLAESMQKLVDMERTAFGMDVKDSGLGTDPLAQALAGFTPARAVSALQALEQLRKHREAAAGAT